MLIVSLKDIKVINHNMYSRPVLLATTLDGVSNCW